MDATYSEIEVETVVYSSVSNFEMDIYQALDNLAPNKPVVVLAHGGGFINGSKENPLMVRLATDFAKRGYVAVSINYSLSKNFPELFDSVKATQLVVNAVGDGMAAVRFLCKTIAEGNPYRINSEKIFFGGNSAGALIAAHVALLDSNDVLSPHLQAYLDEVGGFQGNRGNSGYSSKITAAFSMAGAVKSIAMIDADDSPIICFHGLNDNTIPINCGNVYESFTQGMSVVKICGSAAIQQRAEEVGLECELNIFNAGHTPWKIVNDSDDNPVFNEVESKILAFFSSKL